MNKISGRFGEQFVEIPVPQVAEQSGARFVFVPMLRRVFRSRLSVEGTLASPSDASNTPTKGCNSRERDAMEDLCK